MTISLRLSDEDPQLIKGYAAMKKMSVSDVMRNAVLEAIEDEYDLQAYYMQSGSLLRQRTMISLLPGPKRIMSGLLPGRKKEIIKLRLLTLLEIKTMRI